MFVEKQLGLTV